MNKNISIRQAVTTGSSDSGPWPLTELEYMGKPDRAVNLTPYGVYSRAPDGAINVVLPINEGGDTKYAIGQKYADRFKDLEKGEVAIGNVETGKFIFFKSDGSIVAHDFTVEGDLNVTGDANITGELTAADAILGGIRFTTHFHSDPQGGATGPAQGPP
jgi:phage gp45-like